MSTLSPDQHNRYLEVLDAAKILFGGDLDAALHWLSCPLKAFGGKPPAAMITTRQETDTVIDFIRRLEHGFVA
ncbi:MbcA/ParS/Xre antitoxin family protein [Pseudomonas sp. yb_1]|uniref:MbcA/ParS/Xre antitoxin family protein n=1 Tax=Pseudomonas TaxID=286 RepID=UPI000FBB963B